MGCSFSCKTTSSSSSSSKSNTIKIVDMNGNIEEMEYPVTVGQVIGKPMSHLLFTQAQLLAPGSKPLKLDTPLEPSQVYFLLPCTLFDSHVSPLDLAPIARKLASVAKSNQRKKTRTKKKKNSVSSSVSGCSNNVWSSPARSPDRLFSDNGSKTTTWKPVLATIREKSFNRRSESELQASVKVDSAE